MVDDFPSNTRVLLARSAHAAELEAFARWLGAEGYSGFVVHQHLLRLEQVLPHLPGPTCSEQILRRHFAVVGRGVPTRPGRFHGTAHTYERFLRAGGRLVSTIDTSPTADLQAGYAQQLLELRGLSLSSRQHHAQTVRDFLDRGLPAGRSLAALVPEDIEHYVALRSSEVSRHSLQHVVGQLRSFLRYCHDQGVTDRRLDAVETVRTYRGELLPQALAWDDVQTLLRRIDPCSKAGRRDRCMLHLMAHYGLRPSEVIALRLDSIDWDRAVLHVHQSKTRSDLDLPLVPATVALLQDYLQHERSAQGNAPPHLFLRVRCPTGALLRTAVGNIFEKRARQAGLDLPGRHVYCLRHTFAMRLLTQGVGVKSIGDLLGHRSLESTCAYLRMDIDALRDVALEVPAVGVRRRDCHA